MWLGGGKTESTLVIIHQRSGSEPEMSNRVQIGIKGLRRLRRLVRRCAHPRQAKQDADRRKLEVMRGFPGDWEPHRQFQIEFLRTRGLQQHHSLLELGCGPLCGGLPVIDYLEPGRYYGLDVRQESIGEAHLQLAKAQLAHKNPRLLVSSTFGGEEIEPRCFDFVWAFAVLQHLDDLTAATCLEQVSRRLTHDSVFYANVNVEHPQGQWHEFVFVQKPLRFYEDLGDRYGLRMDVVGQLKDVGYLLQDATQFNYVVAFRK